MWDVFRGLGVTLLGWGKMGYFQYLHFFKNSTKYLIQVQHIVFLLHEGDFQRNSSNE